MKPLYQDFCHTFSAPKSDGEEREQARKYLLAELSRFLEIGLVDNRNGKQYRNFRVTEIECATREGISWGPIPMHQEIVRIYFVPT